METITWVGIDHYIEPSALEDFYGNLKVGDVVTLVLEPENFWDSRAIAVFHKFIMRGHISRHESGPVHIMAENNADMVGRITDDIDPELNQVKLTIDSVKANMQNEYNYPRLAPSVLGIEMTPHVMYEEYSYVQIKKAVDDMVRTIKKNDIDSILVGVNVKEIISALEIYLTIWDKSISIEANRLPRYFDEVLTHLSLLSQSIKVELRPMLKKLRNCTALQPKMEHNVEVFINQMEHLEKYYSAEDGFYSVYDKEFEGKPDKMQSQIEKISSWLNCLSGGRNCNFRDFKSFVHILYCDGYRAQDLYMIITHMLVLRRLAIKLYNLPCDITVENLVVNGSVNIFGNAKFRSEGDMNIDKVIKNNGIMQ